MNRSADAKFFSATIQAKKWPLYRDHQAQGEGVESGPAFDQKHMLRELGTWADRHSWLFKADCVFLATGRVAIRRASCCAVAGGIGKNARQLTGTEMEQIALYKDFRIRAYQDWSGQWSAEAKKPFDANPEYIGTPLSHPTAEAAIDLVKQLIDSEGTQGSPHMKPSNEDNSGSAMLAALRAEFPAHIFVPRKRE
jgi:hypothetical protein